MAFPQTKLEARVDLLVDGAWSNITDDVRVADSIVVRRGRADEASQPDPSTANLTLDNRDGVYSSRNPSSSLYGKIGRNTPLRVGVGTPAVAGATAGQTGTSIVAPSVTTELNSTVFCVWGAAPGGNITGPAGFTMGVEQDGALSTWAGGVKTVAVLGASGTFTATHSVSAASAVGLTVAVPGSILAGGFSQVASDRGYVDCGVTGVTGGDYLLAIQGWSSDADNRMTAAPALADYPNPDWIALADTGPSTGVRLRAWICRLPADAAATQTVRGARYDTPGIQAVAGGGDNFMRVWRLAGSGPNPAVDYICRHIGEVSSWPQRWDPAGVDVRAPITSSGVLRRLGQGGKTLRSSLNRHIVRSADVVGYWPCEEAEGNIAFASPIAGVGPATFRGTPILATDDGFLGSDPLPTWQAAGFVGTVPNYTSTGELFMGALFSIPAGGMAASGANLLSVGFTGGTIARAIMEYQTTGDLAIKVYDRNSATVPVLNTSPGTDFSFDGDRFFAWLWFAQSGADIQCRVAAIGIVDGSYQFRVGRGSLETIAGQTLGSARAVTAGIEGFNASNGALSLTAPVTIGHITIASKAQAVFRSDFLHYYPAIGGHASEGAIERIVRLCREEGIDVLGTYDQPDSAGPYAVDTAALGPQRSGDLLELLRQAADADGGILYEPRGFLGLAYRPRASRENQAADVTLTYGTAGHIADPFEPVDDDQSTRNDITVTRIGGAGARAVLEEGPLSIQPPPDGVGPYEDSVELSLWRDAQAADAAGWRLHLGTWDEARYPQVSTWLEGHPADIPTVAAIECGDRIDIASLPSWMPPGPAEIGVEGYAETLAPRAWRITYNASPSGPYRVPELDSADFGRLDSDDSTLSSAVSSVATNLLVATTAGSPLWITTATHPTEFPFDAIVGGEVVRVTAITGTTSPQTFSTTRSINGIAKAHSIGTQISLHKPVYVAQGGDQ